jgi:hypothetical protein
LTKRAKVLGETADKLYMEAMTMNAKRIKTMKVERMTATIQKRLEAFGFQIVWIKFVSYGHTVIGYK